MASLTRYNWFKLYKDLQRVALQFPQYNYRHFARRRIRDYFESNRNVTDQKTLLALYADGLRELESLKRQVFVSTLYPNKKLVIEE